MLAAGRTTLFPLVQFCEKNCINETGKSSDMSSHIGTNGVVITGATFTLIRHLHGQKEKQN